MHKYQNQKTEERLCFEDKYIVNFEGYIDNLDELEEVIQIILEYKQIKLPWMHI